MSIKDYLTNEEVEELKRGIKKLKDEQEKKMARVVRLADINPEEVTWLWEPYLPVGKLTILEGDPAAGKTWLALAITTAVSLGRGFLDQYGRPVAPFEPGNVLYLTAEDGLADTIRPRLDSLGADVNRIYSVVADDTGNTVTLADIAALDVVAADVTPHLIVIDPLQAYLGAGVDMHRANETRPVLARLAALAERHKCAVLCLRHLTKAPTGRAIYRGMGSIDFTAAARSVLLAGVDPKDENRRAVVQIKNSLAPLGVSLGYSLTRVDGFNWSGLSELTKSDLLAGEREPEEKSATDEARDWLLDILADGPVESKKILKEARRAGISERTLHRVKASLEIKSMKIGNSWVWKIVNPLRNFNGNVGNVPSIPTATRDLEEEPILPDGNVGVRSSILTAARAEEKIAKIARVIHLEKKNKDRQLSNLESETKWQGSIDDLPNLD